MPSDNEGPKGETTGQAPAMIVSVGGTPAPIITSLIEHNPGYVCFLVSQESMDLIGEIKQRTRDAGVVFEDRKVIVEDAQDLVHCYRKACECGCQPFQEGPARCTPLVDYTGGTKTMSAALAMAAVHKGFNFTYVGGRRRTKDGLGIVVDGSEQVYDMISPWALYAVEERSRIAQLVASCRYHTAADLLGETAVRLTTTDRPVWLAMADIMKGFAHWDNFNHKTAHNSLNKGFRSLERIHAYLEDIGVIAFYEAAEKCLDRLEVLKSKTKGFKKMHAAMVADLVANSRRRAIQEKYDDAVARLYRAMEMAGQVAFEGCFGQTNSDVPAKIIPETLRTDYTRRYGKGPKQLLKIPATATFRVLQEAGDPLGHRFFENRNIIDDLLSARNLSILAHGQSPVKKDTYERFLDLVTELFVSEPMTEFPMLYW